MTKPQRHIAKWVLGNIDEDGFLRRSVEQLVDDLAFQEGLVVSDEEMADIVGQIKDFDPPGVASATLQECLLKQLSVKPQTPSVVLAQQLLADYFDDFSQHRFDRISAKLNIDDEALKQARVGTVAQHRRYSRVAYQSRLRRYAQDLLRHHLEGQERCSAVH